MFSPRRGKHSAWQSTHHRADARTHYPQRNSAQKPSSGRKGDHEVVEGARVTFSLREFYCHALSLSRLTATAPSRREPFAYSHRQKNTTKEKSLVVFVFSPLKLQRRWVAFVFGGDNRAQNHAVAPWGECSKFASRTLHISFRLLAAQKKKDTLWVSFFFWWRQ